MPLTIFQGDGAVVAARDAAKARSLVVNLETAGRETFEMIETLAPTHDVILALPAGWSCDGKTRREITLKKPDGSVTLSVGDVDPVVVGEPPVSSRLRQILMLGAAS